MRNSRDGVRWDRVIKLQLEKSIYFTWPYEEGIGIKGVWEYSYETQLNERMNLQSGGSQWHQGWDVVRGEPWNGSKFLARKNREWREGCRTKPAKCLHSRVERKRKLSEKKRRKSRGIQRRNQPTKRTLKGKRHSETTSTFKNANISKYLDIPLSGGKGQNLVCAFLLQSWKTTVSRCLTGKESACQCRRHRRHEFDPWVRKIPWRRQWQPTPVFLPGESHGQRSQGDYSP